MLTVIMECKDQEAALAQTLSSLVTGAVQGLVSDVIILDHGSVDGSARVADSAGCRFHHQWDLRDIVRSARGEWVMLLAPGARPQTGWVDEVLEYVAISKVPARFSPSRTWRRPFFERLRRKTDPLEAGFLLSKRQALAVAKSGMALSDISTGLAVKTLKAELVPAWVLARTLDE